jgi:hypothetical protein
MTSRIALGMLFLTVACAGAKGTTTTAVKPTASASKGPAMAGGVTTAILAGRAKLTPLLSEAWQALDSIELAPAKTLYVGASGQRWVAVEQKAPRPDDPEYTRTLLTAAPSMAPETLVAVRKRANGSFLFIGESGATYLAPSALADLTTRRSPPEALRAVAAGKDAILGITHHDTLLRSTDGGANYATIAVSNGDAIPTLLVANPRGEALVFFAPGRIAASFDDGSTFRSVPNDGLGATSLFSSSNGSLFARGYSVSPTKPPGLASVATTTATLKRAADGSPMLERSKGGLSFVSRPMDDEDRLELAEGIRNGHAVFEDLRYLEVRATDDGELLHAITLEKGAIAHHPPIAATKGCEFNHVAAAGNTIEFLCSKFIETKKGEREQIHLFRSADFGKTFTADGALEVSDSQRRVVIGAAGHVIVAGGCLQPQCTDDPLLVRPAGSKAFVAAKLPKGHRVTNPAQIRIGSADQVYAIATHDEESGLFLLSSKDAGRTFIARPVVHDEEHFIDDVQEIAIDEKSGTVALFSSGDPTVRFSTKNDGVAWTASELPFSAEWMAIAGARGLATSGLAPGLGYETLDYGATWGVVALPTTSSVGGTIPIACSQHGCMLGDIALREGWEFATNADVKPPKTEPTKPSTPVHPAVVECASDGAEIELGVASEPIADPSPAVAWAMLVESDKGAIDIVSWPQAGKTGKTIARTSLLAAAKEPMATKRLNSADGVIVLRTPRGGDAKAVTDIELAWWTPSAGTVHRATLAKAGTPAGKWGSVNAVATIVPGYGVYVRIAAATDAVTYLARENGAISKLALPATFPSLQRMYARRAGTQTMFVGAPNESTTGDRIATFALLTDKTDKSEVKTFTWGLWPRLPRGRTEVGYAGDQVIVTWPGSETIAPRHLALSLKDAGAEPPEPVAIPVARELAACDGKATGARIELPWTTGSRTPIIVKYLQRTLFHATNTTVGRVGKPACASAQVAGVPGGTGNEWTVIDGAATRGFLFVRNKTHAVVPLQCARTSTALPTAFANARGFSK